MPMSGAVVPRTSTYFYASRWYSMPLFCSGSFYPSRNLRARAKLYKILGRRLNLKNSLRRLTDLSPEFYSRKRGGGQKVQHFDTIFDTRHLRKLQRFIRNRQQISLHLWLPHPYVFSKFGTVRRGSLKWQCIGNWRLFYYHLCMTEC